MSTLHGEEAIYEWSSTTWRQRAARLSKTASFSRHTNQPCCMCMSSILWSAFKAYIFLSHAHDRPRNFHDINTMHELWASICTASATHLASICIMI
jgi:tRNA(Arg) A34 adenosine deaminase TadA